MKCAATGSTGNSEKRTDFRNANPSSIAARNHGNTDTMMMGRTTTGRSSFRKGHVKSSQSAPHKDQADKSQTPQLPDVHPSNDSAGTPSGQADQAPSHNTPAEEGLEEGRPKKRSRTWANNVVC